MKHINWPLTGALVVMAAILFFLYSVKFAIAQDHHPQGIHEKFYSTWMMPDNRSVSCCHNDDCSPAEAHQDKSGNWYARQLGDPGDFTLIPPKKVEHDRDTPDGRNHLCGKRYSYANGEFTTFCFIAGNGS